jgi:23S rRNA-/tRNA-specific pseudouridylate synthase
MKTEWRMDLKKRGILYAIQDKHMLKEKMPYNVIFEDENFLVYKL